MEVGFYGFVQFLPHPQFQKQIHCQIRLGDYPPRRDEMILRRLGYGSLLGSGPSFL